jgi:hypothetical protein
MGHERRMTVPVPPGTNTVIRDGRTWLLPRVQVRSWWRVSLLPRVNCTWTVNSPESVPVACSPEPCDRCAFRWDAPQAAHPQAFPYFFRVRNEAVPVVTIPPELA